MFLNDLISDMIWGQVCELSDIFLKGNYFESKISDKINTGKCTFPKTWHF
jgi:hypothetical protein